MRGSILVLCPFPVGVAAGQRLKYEQYLDDWRAMGFRVEVRPFMDEALWSVAHREGKLVAKFFGTLRGYWRRHRQLRDVEHFDLVYLFHWLTPVGRGGAESRLRRRARRIVLDVEDNVLDGLSGGLGPSPLLARLRGTDKTRYLVQHCDHVIASSPELADLCRSLNRRAKATYITSSVDTDRFVPANPDGGDPVVLGWTGTISSRPFLDSLADVLRDLAQTRRFRLRVIGNFDYALPGVDLEVVRWNAADEVTQLQGIDIGLYPLPDNAWVGGKSGLKAIQYAAVGIPCVATNVGHTPEVVTHGVTGLLVDDRAGWIDALTRLIDDRALRERLGQAGRARAVERYSLTAVAKDYRRVLESVIGAPAGAPSQQDDE